MKVRRDKGQGRKPWMTAYANIPGSLQKRTRAATLNAVRVGTLVRPSHCSRCTNTSIEAHHPDYSKPLDVVWLCSKCHGKEHARLDRKAWIATKIPPAPRFDPFGNQMPKWMVAECRKCAEYPALYWGKTRTFSRLPGAEIRNLKK